MKKLFTLIAVAAMAFAAQAAEVTVADGTNTGEYAPVYGYNYDMDQHNQMQYPVAELAGMSAGSEITAVKFYTSTPDAVNALGGSVKVSLANMVDVTPWTLDAWGNISGDLLVVDVTTVAATVTPAADADGVWTITFDVPFTYYGGALLVDVEAIETGSWGDTYFYGKEMGAYYVMSSYGYAGSKKGQTVLPKVTFTYDGGEEPGLATLAEANALEDAAEFKFDGDAVVTAFKNGYLFLRDESGYGMIAGVTGEFVNGQVLSEGWNATKTSNDGWVWFTDATDLSASGETNADLAAAQKITAFPDESLLNAYVYVEKVNKNMFPIRTLPLEGGNITIASYPWAVNQPASSGDWNAYGIIVKNNGVLEFALVAWEKYVEPQPEVNLGDVNGDGFINLTDVTLLISAVVNSDNSAIIEANADMNEDGELNLTDVTLLINLVMSL